jgi:hypothetical protein
MRNTRRCLSARDTTTRHTAPTVAAKECSHAHTQQAGVSTDRFFSLTGPAGTASNGVLRFDCRSSAPCSTRHRTTPRHATPHRGKHVAHLA